MLVDVLRNKKDALEETIINKEDSNVSSELREVEDFLKKLDEDLYSIRNIDAKHILEKLYDENRLEEALLELKSIKKLLVGKIDMNLKSLELTEEQHKFIEDLKEEVRLLKEEMTKEKEKYDNSKEKKEVDKYDAILEKINNNEIFDSSDLEVLELILNDEEINIQDRIKLAKEILNHNKKDETKIIKTDIKDIIELFNSYDFSDKEKEDLKKLINKHKKELETSFDIDNAKEVLDYLCLEDKDNNKVDIIRRFEKEDLLIIAMCSTVDVVKKRYNELMDETIEIYKREAGFWCDDEMSSQITKRKSSRKKKTKEEIRYEKEHALRMKSKRCDYYNSKQNEEFFKEKALTYNFSDERNATVLLKPNHIIRKNYEALVDYGILAKYEKYHDSNLIPSTVFASSELREKCDKLIEVGLLNPEMEETESNTNYVCQFPTILYTLSDRALLKLSVQKQLASTDMEFYSNIFGVDSKTGRIRRTFIGGANTFGSELATDEVIKRYKENNSITGISECLDNYEEIEKEYNKLEPQTSNYDESNNFIVSLDEKIGIENNKYIYKVGKQAISRLKVIRIYSILKNSNKFTSEDIKTFSLLYGTYINPNTYKYVRNMLDNNMEVSDGISR